MKILLFLAIWFLISIPVSLIAGRLMHEMGKDYPLVEDKDDES